MSEKEKGLVSRVIDCIHVDCMTHMTVAAQNDEENSALFVCKGCGYTVVVSRYFPEPEKKAETESAKPEKTKREKKEKAESE
jgi:hypothetical protein